MSPPIERSWAKESPRDQDESAFTPILRRLLYRTTGVLAVSFVDQQGECVDYCAALDPFDAKVAGAQMQVTMSHVAARMAKLGAGQSWQAHVHASGRDFVVRRVSDDYLLVVVLKPSAFTRRLLGGVDHAVTELRREASIPIPLWEPVTDSVRVECRDAVGWPYAPAAYFEGDRRVGVDDVLGRWMEGRGRQSRVYFRVRNDEGEELTLVHDRGLDRWERSRERA